MPDKPLHNESITREYPQTGSKGNPATGHVALVGAGPGEPSAITLRAIECLQQCDVVLFDYLVNPSMLGWVNPNALQISLGSHKEGKRLLSQDEVNQKLVELAIAGKRVVRLKSGDPIVFARVAEETAVLQAAGIDFEIVPGITSALAAGSFAGIPLTHRDHSSAVALVTGHRAMPESTDAGDAKPDGCPTHIDWRALAKFPGTLVVYMGTTQVEYWSSELIQGGLPASTPVAIVRRCGFSDQRIWNCCLEDVAQQVNAPKRIRPPVVFVIGSVADASLQLKWFQQRPLHQKQVLITRPAAQSQSMRTALERMGANVLNWPAIEIKPVDDPADLDSAIKDLPQFDWVAFSSVNGVDFWMKRLRHLGYDARQFGNVKIAAIGEKTADRLLDYSLRSDLTPETFDADHLAAELAEKAAGKKVLLVRASRGRQVLRQQLSAAKAEVREVVTYQSIDAGEPDQKLLDLMESGEIDWVTMTSSAIARNTIKSFGQRLKKTALVTISPITTAVINEQGFQAMAEASTFTSQGVIDAIAAASRSDVES